MNVDEMMLHLKALCPFHNLGIAIRYPGDWYLIGKDYEEVDGLFATGLTEVGCSTPEAAVEAAFQAATSVQAPKALRVRKAFAGSSIEQAAYCVRWNGVTWERVPEPVGAAHSDRETQ